MLMHVERGHLMASSPRLTLRLNACVAHVPQISFSKIGVCQMASAVIFEGTPAVSLNDYEIVSGKRRRSLPNVVKHGRCRTVRISNSCLTFLPTQ
jgi:hypothetical protein